MNLIALNAKRVALTVLLCLMGCSTVKTPISSEYTVDPNTVWQTVELTPEGTHYGVDLDGVSRNGPFRTVWLQIRSANHPYLYDKLQINFNCVEKRFMLMLRTVIKDNQVIAVQYDLPLAYLLEPSLRPPFLQWRDVEAGSREDKIMAKACLLAQ